MKVSDNSMRLLFFAALFAVIFSDCADVKKKQYGKFSFFSSYLEVPGITDEEIEAIESFRDQVFIFGMPMSTEAYINENGVLSGFSVLFCEWLTGFFGIPFQPALYEWQDLIAGLIAGVISFSGELTVSEERLKTFYMTSAIASRPVKSFRITGSRPLWEIAETRCLRNGFIQGSSSIGVITSEMESGTFEIIELDGFNYVYDALKSGEIDVFYFSGVAEINFIEYSDIAAQEFYPLTFLPVSFLTGNSALQPLVSVVDKALKNGDLHYLTLLYNRAHRDYLKFRLYKQLTAAERAYIINNPVVPIGVDPGNYPASFYDRREGEWRGIFLDILNEITLLTGITFHRVNDEYMKWPEIYQMLVDGELALVTELTQTNDRAGQFLWPETTQLIDYYALISNIDYPDIKINEALYVRVGLAKDTAYTAIFRKWFPGHLNTVEYESMVDAFNALLYGEVDMVMANQKRLLYLTHYLEQPDYKTNVVFDYAMNAKFGLNKNEEVLASIIDKALGSIESRAISDYWIRRTYDYRIKVEQARTPWIIGVTLLFLCVLVLVISLFIKNRHSHIRLQRLVEKRTYELALQTTTLTTLFDSIPDLIFTKDLHLHYLHCNKAFLDHFGRSKNELIGKSFEEGLGMVSAITEDINYIDRKVLAEGLILAFEERIPRVDGSKPYYETIKMPLILNEEVVGIMGISRDITKRKEMERTIASNYEYAKKLSNALAEITKSPTISAGILKDAADVIAQEGCKALNTDRIVIWRFVHDGYILECISYYNAGTGKITVQDNNNLSNRPEYLKLLQSERLIVMSNTDDCDLVSDAFDGYTNSLCAALDAPIRVDGNLVGVVCVEQGPCEEFPAGREWMIEEQNFASSLADLMALAISGSERRNARDAAEMASKTKSSFLANMSHEIRTPMNAILGVTEFMIQKETLPADVEEGLDKIYSSCDLLLGIINDILDFSKIEAGRLDIMPAQYKVASLINDSVHLNMMRIESKPIEFELHVDENIPAKLIGDELRIKQILNNLLSNAFKYTEKGMVSLSVVSESIPLLSYLPDHSMSNQVHWTMDKEGVTLVLSVKDTGHGMTKKQLSMMFDEYSRFDHERNITIEGTGLGLAITRRLISFMNGNIHVESTPGEGSLFTVRLPQEKVDEEVLGREVVANLKQFRRSYMSHQRRGQFVRDPMPYGSVLIVDDVETNLYVAVGLMKLYRLCIDTAMNGKDAIKKIKDGKVYDIVFMDHMMPEMDGIETTKHLRNFGYTNPIVALTANAVAGQADMFLQNGFNDFISKPIDIRQLNAVLNRLVRDKQPPEVVEAARLQKNGANGNTPSRNDLLLTESFIRDARKAVAVLDELCEKSGFENEEDLRNFTIVVHGIKSSLGNIGETALAETASRLEKDGRGNIIDQIKTSTPAFLRELCALIDKLQEKTTGGDEGSGFAGEDIGDLRDKLLAIRNMCADYDRKGVLEKIAEFNHCSKKTKEALDKIKAYAFHSEFDEAGSVAEAYLAALPPSVLPPADGQASSSQGQRLLPKKVSGLDMAKGLERYDGDEKTYLKILRSYSASLRSMLGSIEAVSGDTLAEYRIAAHGIKGTSFDIFADQIGREAQNLEEAAKAGDFSYIKDHNPGFLDVGWSLVSGIEALFLELEAENPKPKKGTPDAALLSKMLAACRVYDVDAADEVMAEIEKYQYESDGGIADWLRESIDMMHFTQIVEKLSGLESER